MISTTIYPATVGVGSLLEYDTASSELAWQRLVTFLWGGKIAEEVGNCGYPSLALKYGFGGVIVDLLFYLGGRLYLWHCAVVRPEVGYQDHSGVNEPMYWPSSFHPVFHFGSVQTNLGWILIHYATGLCQVIHRGHRGMGTDGST
jgi:hypothetical protein